MFTSTNRHRQHSKFCKEKNTGRVIIKEDQGISIEGYTADEVKELLEILMDEDKDD